MFGTILNTLFTVVLDFNSFLEIPDLREKKNLVLNQQATINNWEIYWHFQLKGQWLFKLYNCIVPRPCIINTRRYYN